MTLLLLLLFIPENRVFRVLLPFGLPFGDELLPPFLFATSDPQSKLAISNITCPFFGRSESIIHVSIVPNTLSSTIFNSTFFSRDLNFVNLVYFENCARVDNVRNAIL